MLLDPFCYRNWVLPFVPYLVIRLHITLHCSWQSRAEFFLKKWFSCFFTFYFHYCGLTIIWYTCLFFTLQNSHHYFPFVCSPDLLSFFLLFTHILYHVYSRYATRCPRSFPHDAAWEASYDVQCHPCQRDPSCLQEVYARCNYTS